MSPAKATAPPPPPAGERDTGMAIRDFGSIFIRRGKPARVKRRKPSRLAAIVASALTWLFASMFIGAGATVLGIFILAGIGWGIVAIGITFLAIAALLQIGIARG